MEDSEHINCLLFKSKFLTLPYKIVLFGAVKLTKNYDIDKYKYSGYGIEFDLKGAFTHPSGGIGQNVVFLELIWVLLCMVITK